MVCKAEYYQQSGEYQKCFDLTSRFDARFPSKFTNVVL